MGWGCGSRILKQATMWRSYWDDRRHDTDETSNYLPNGRQIRGKGRKTVGWTDEGLTITFERDTKVDVALVVWCDLSSQTAKILYLSHKQ